MSWFRRKKPKITELVDDKERTVRTEGVFIKCSECGAALYKGELEESEYVCPKCGYHFRMGARERLKRLFDNGIYEPLDEGVMSSDPLEFFDSKSYKQRIEEAKAASGLPEAVVTGKGVVGGHLVFAGVMDMSFIGGSMGSAVGEKITRLIERAIKERGAVVIFSASGGARMQEGILSLMQMAKISAALGRLHEERLPYISVMTDPTTGGVTASFAMLGDVNIAEPKALIGFAGPRVIEQTIRQKLPKGFQRSEFLLEHGMLDMVVDRRQMRQTIIRLLDFMMNDSLTRK
ncbi:MAG: acetyl-CoA carboxylase, carboxyltransferase subunit beta [Pyrinomonadaceae bacterium]|nr:acetyl-CoA carboxylase, carboxyltransferase subunit beta [Pyrinomonadaceae bacterium]MCX7638823.1 acetyl-CoA carboxylase, carboxyltransferase subunit beta [Pyrinomonadaceae bacterium]MDW8305041.1 acetyl-CoA carboxylase, carboxyltransferase subunit beta [Acidobacteriota bacterium]